MRHVLFCAILVSTLARPAQAEDVTIVLDFREPASDQAIAEMKHEFAGIMKGSKLTFEWKSPAEAEQTSADNLVVVRFKGACVLKPVPYLFDERGPMAVAYSGQDGVMPFSEVECDQVTRAVRSAMWGGDLARADVVMGRALGRVLAHEMVHMLTKSPAHGRAGVARPALTGSQLVRPELRLMPEDLDRLRSDR
jgi:hypothetical protein